MLGMVDGRIGQGRGAHTIAISPGQLWQQHMLGGGLTKTYESRTSPGLSQDDSAKPHPFIILTPNITVTSLWMFRFFYRGSLNGGLLIALWTAIGDSQNLLRDSCILLVVFSDQT